MIGQNVLTLNKATILAALNHYFKDVIYQDGQVPSAISLSEVQSGADQGSFRVLVDTKPED